MIPQPASPQRPNVSTTSDHRSFWLAALLGLPAVNVAFLSVVAFAGSDIFFPTMALAAAGQLALLIIWSPKHGVGVLGALGAMLAVAVITALGLFLVALVTLSIACSGEAQCFG